MKKIIYLLLIVVVVGGLGFYFYKKSAQEAKAPERETVVKESDETAPSGANATSTGSQPEQPKASSTVKTETKTPGNVSQGTFSNGEEETGPNIQVVEVDYNGTSFSPATITVNVGDYVFFKNSSSTGFWPASDPHPTHTNYPGFDAGKTIAAGGTYKFQFTKAGTWGYHNHLNPSQHGTVTVVGQ